MRRSHVRSVLVLPACAALALCAAAAAVAQDLPARKPGLWEITMQVTNAPTQSMRQCIDAQSDRQLQRFGQGVAGQECTRNVVRRDGERWVGESECRSGASTLTSRSVFAGDFDRAYRGEVETRYQPPIAGISQSKVTLNARWIGACPAGWKPGDMEMAGMGRINVNEMMSATSGRK